MKIKVMIEFDVNRVKVNRNSKTLLPIPSIKQAVLSGLKYGISEGITCWKYPSIEVKRLEIIK